MDPVSPELSPAPAPGGITTPAAAKKKKKPRESNVKETIESIIIAFILAFIFRAFVVEAFVIPTGSMAPTLLGAHMRFTCPDCGYRFDSNYSPSAGVDGEADSPTGAMKSEGGRRPYEYCPNCGFHMPADDLSNKFAGNPPVRYGDRILVLKYLYLLQNPQRWDVVVFKSPTNQKEDDFTVNFIKRLIARPNESVMILDGNIYVGDKDARPEDMKIQRKTRIAQDALWRIVYDNDYYPQQVKALGSQWQQPWKPRGAGAGWKLGDGPLNGRVFHFDNASGEGAIAFDQHTNPTQFSFTDWLAYDVDLNGPYPNRQLASVGDLKLQFQYTRKSGDGPLRAQLSQRGVTFTAEFSPTSVRLLSKDERGQETELRPPVPLGTSGNPMVEFSNVDCRVSIRVDGNTLIEYDYEPPLKELLASNDNGTEKVVRPGAAIEARNQSTDISHLSLWRDVYYIEPGPRTKFQNDWASRSNIMRLGPDEYFVCGDNSAMSSDGRYWLETVNLPQEGLQADSGRVPGRFLLGRAFFVYWPAGYQPLPGSGAPALVPNFGDMRFIR